MPCSPCRREDEAPLAERQDSPALRRFADARLRGAAERPRRGRARLREPSGLVGDWLDWGWSPRTIEPGRAARIDMTAFGGWVVANWRLRGRFDALRFELRAPVSFGDFLEVLLIGADG
jgi:hypothetical protein